MEQQGAVIVMYSTVILNIQYCKSIFKSWLAMINKKLWKQETIGRLVLSEDNKIYLR